jgi:hypothetical protein
LSNALDVRPLSPEELLSALHLKFSTNFEACRPSLNKATDAERQARTLSSASKHLERRAGDVQHQRALATYLDEIFGDSICAVYLACSGLNIPARMLLRRSLELGLVVASYWDSPVDFWTWREHDGNIRFADLCRLLQSEGYRSLLRHQPIPSRVDSGAALQGLEELYGELSDVVHPKPRNFSTAGVGAYQFDPGELEKTLNYANRVHSAIATILAARFAELEPILSLPSPTAN